MENIKVNLHFLKKAWEASDGNPHLVCFPGLITMIIPISLLQFHLQPCRDPSLPELDAQWYRCQVWEAIVDAAIRDGVHVQSNLLQFDWGLMRRKLVKAVKRLTIGMPIGTARQRGSLKRSPSRLSRGITGVIW
jgi:hypothetical protein